jgi:fibronectin-binding autotransporter adhesin
MQPKSEAIVTVSVQNRRIKRFVQRKSRRNFAVVSSAVLATMMSRHVACGAVNWIWTDASTASAGTWAAGNFIRLDTGVSTTLPGSSANVVFTDDVLSNSSNYQIGPAGTAGGSGNITVPSPIVIPTTTNVSINDISFGDNETGTGGGAAGPLQLSTSFTLGSSANTITLNGAAGLNRQVAATDGAISLKATSGTQTIAANIAVTSSQTWALGGPTGEVVITGNVSTSASNQTITKSGTGELEFNPSNPTNPSLFTGSYIAQGGETLLGNGNALGSSAVQLGNTSTKTPTAVSILLGSGVTFSNALSTIGSSATPGTSPSLTVGGSAGTSNTWAGAITINPTSVNQGIQLSGGTAGGVTTFTGVIQDGSGAVPSNDPVTVTGTGTVILAPIGTNTFGGAFTAQSGTTVVGNANALSSAASVLVTNASSTAPVSLLTNDTVNFAKNVTVGGATQFGAVLGGYGNNGSASSTTWSGTITLNQATTLTGGGGTVNFTQPIQDGTLITGSNPSSITVNSGTIILSGTSNYSGTTTISSGALQLASTGSLAGSGALTVGSGGNLSGTGSALAAVNVSSGGTLEAGAGLGNGTLSTGSVNFTGGNFSVALNSGNGPTGTTDTLASSGTIALGASAAQLQLTDVGSGSVPFGTVFVIISSPTTGAGGISGNFANLADTTTISAGLNTYEINYGTAPGFSDDVTLTAVPEPMGIALLSLAGSMLMRRRRKRISEI